MWLEDAHRQLLTPTFRAVVSLPAFQADAVALLVAGVVAQRVVSRPAVVSTAVSKVVLITEDVIGVAQLTLLAKVHVLGPVLADSQSPPGRQATHEVVLVVCRRKERFCSNFIKPDTKSFLAINCTGDNKPDEK